MSSRILADRDYLPSVAARAWRWEPEMLEIADTLRAQGLPADLAEAAGRVFARLETAKDCWTMSSTNSTTDSANPAG